ncbi:SufE family protein [Photobacterium phosphoreum]|uniref:SufE family protein n=1 Tax=Photobacterium phosphoreum TaxID=659 RepID=UPI0024B74D65|nr:SufE family protein [Photobacterium phosphoreum]
MSVIITPQKILLNFQRCTSWEDKYLYLIELGDRFCRLPLSAQTDNHKLRGCQSRVWITLDKSDTTLQFAANSDAAIVKGLLALIIIAYDQKTSQQIAAFNIDAWFEQLGLTQHLTATRAIGIATIIKQVQLMSGV